jgi:hypothetical protein
MRLSFRSSLVGGLALTVGVLFAAPALGSSNRPSAPRSVHASASSAAVTVSWAKPSSSGGSPITKYVVTSLPSAKKCTTTKLTCKVLGLKNGASYSFTVVAYNKHGAGARSAASKKVTPKASTGKSRVLVATPSTGLSNGESVKVTGSGFTPGDSVFLIECLATSTNQSGCDVASATPVTVGAKGTIASTTFKVLTGKIGNGTCGTTSANAGACAINAGNMTGGDSSQAVIKFKS